MVAKARVVGCSMICGHSIKVRSVASLLQWSSLCIATVMWHEVPAKLPPLARRHHTLVQLRSGESDKLFLFGGSTLQQGVASQDLAHCSLRGKQVTCNETDTKTCESLARCQITVVRVMGIVTAHETHSRGPLGSQLDKDCRQPRHSVRRSRHARAVQRCAPV